MPFFLENPLNPNFSSSFFRQKSIGKYNPKNQKHFPSFLKQQRKPPNRKVRKPEKSLNEMSQFNNLKYWIYVENFYSKKIQRYKNCMRKY